jgi:hypothetical protein
MKKLFCFDNIFTFLLFELIFLLPVGLYFAWVAEMAEKPNLSEYVHMSQDIPRQCLALGKGKAVVGFEIKENKLNCLFKEEK